MGILKNLYLKFGQKVGFIEPSIQTRPPKQILYNIGNVKVHGCLIDELIPQAISIGDNFIAAPNSIIMAHDSSLYNHVSKHRVEKVIIGNNVFLGAGAIILPGVTIGDGAIIGAGAVVTKNVESNHVVAGNPAKFVCTVEDYISKCERKGTLFNTPESFKKYYSNQLTEEDVKLFQKKWLSSKL